VVATAAEKEIQKEWAALSPEKRPAATGHR